jgi:hypothetical protein
MRDAISHGAAAYYGNIFHLKWEPFKTIKLIENFGLNKENFKHSESKKKASKSIEASQIM